MARAAILVVGGKKHEAREPTANSRQFKPKTQVRNPNLGHPAGHYKTLILAGCVALSRISDAHLGKLGSHRFGNVYLKTIVRFEGQKIVFANCFVDLRGATVQRCQALWC